MVSALDSGASASGSSPSRRHCVVFLDKTLYSHGASLRPRCINRCRRITPASTKPGPDHGPDHGPGRGLDRGPDRGPDHGLDHRRKKKF